MGEFDLSLIREFRSRPAFYDRNSPRFKDKLYTAHEWQEISNKLGYDVSLLKDRMLQLRNRYNLEKRRLEQLRDENGGKIVESPWALYHQLEFLSTHIRSRRSYKSMLTLQSAYPTTVAAPELSDPASNPSEYNAAAAPYANGLLAVKMEDEDQEMEEAHDSNSQSDSQSAPENSNTLATRQHSAMHAPNTHLQQTHSNKEWNSSTSHQPATLAAPSITIRRLDTMRHEVAVKKPQERVNAAAAHNNKVSNIDVSTTAPNIAATMETVLANGQIRLSAREKKYAAFGDFIYSSLLELPPRKALLLVEKFTSDVVNVLIQKTETENVSLEGDHNGQ